MRAGGGGRICGFCGLGEGERGEVTMRWAGVARSGLEVWGVGVERHGGGGEECG